MPAWLIGVLYPLAVFGLTVLALLRQSGIAATNSVWAEDGPIFFQQARLTGFWHTLITPYAGYLELAPRLFVQLTRLAPLGDESAVMSASGACLLALICCYVFHASRGVLPPIWSRLLLVAAIIMLPLATGEILDNLVNIGWWMFFAAFWALVTRPRTNTDAILAGLVCLLAIGTEPLVALLLPLALVRVIVMRTDLRQEASVIGLVVGIAYQGIGIIKAHGGTYATATPHGVLQSLGIRVGWGWLSGSDLTNHLIHSSEAAVWQATGYIVLLAVLGGAFLLRHRATTFFVVVAVAFAVITYVVPVFLRGVGPNEMTQPLLVGSRYSATPVLLVWSAVLAEAVQLSRITHGSLLRFAPAVGCLLLLAPVWTLDFRAANLRTPGPEWSEQVSAAVAKCASHPQGKAILQVSPAGWKVVLPCRDVT